MLRAPPAVGALAGVCWSAVRLVHGSGGAGRVVVPPGASLSDVAHTVGGAESEFIARRQQREKFRTAVDGKLDSSWRKSKFHLSKQAKLTDELGVAGAIAETIKPSTPSFRSDLKNRPLDRKILEEIFRELHGKRTERKLRKGIKWEAWVSKGDDTAPVHDAKDRAKQTFGFGGSVDRLAAARLAEEFPVSKVPEVAFIGRTNCGKSSLINAILNAFVCPYGHLPGTTTAANFYNVGGKLTIVDLPGYGFFHHVQTPPAVAATAEKIAREYLRAGGRSDGRGARNVKRVFVCVSAQGVQDTDIAVFELLQKVGCPFAVVIMKSDTQPVRSLARVTDLTRCQLVHYSMCHELLLSSGLRLAGISKIQDLLATFSVARSDAENPVDMLDLSSIV
jgi:GTP-binding protein EngB required for normal cell division